ncbi:MAG: DUF4337 domain-containing protein [Deltaproteobacteria bacterium]|nr:DUF4337 domain-containing protein [Deltaproteobacteria bacterium]
MPEVEIPNRDELEELKGKTFTRRVALVTAVYAVFLAITSLGGSNAMKEMLLAQQQSSDQWSFYQAKVVREHLYRTQKIKLEMELMERGTSLKAEVKKGFQDLIQKMGEEEGRYNREKIGIENEAKSLEKVRDLNRDKDPYFDYAEVLLQISIILASIAILSTSGTIFVFSLISSLLSCFLSFNGFFLIFRIPFLG